ncbi:MAG: aminotransferase class IV [Bacteroidales bacterium]|jgi:branched-chain amino acid aminotransferase|nr:aminotransferase class IV [Bacteroidales bacterium]
MPVNSFILFNGNYHRKDDFGLSYQNRAFCYGDALFETMHAHGTHIQFFTDHMMRLRFGMKTLGMEIPLNIETNTIEKEIIKLLHKNKLYQGVRIRLTVFRNEGGKYTPKEHSVSYLAETEYLEDEQYELNRKGLMVGLYDQVKKPVNKLSNLKSANALVYVQAGIYAQQQQYDDCLLVNEHNHLVEGISSNLFLVKDKVLYTPPLSDGPVAGIMRKQILKIADSQNFRIINEESISAELLLQADEVFLTNSITGIRWVLGYRDRRYFNHTAKLLTDSLNQVAFPEKG